MSVVTAGRRFTRWRRSAITIVLVPSTRGRVRTVTLPALRLTAFLAVLGVLLVVLGAWYAAMNSVVIRLYASGVARQRTLNSISAENSVLRQDREKQKHQLEQLQAKVDDLGTELSRLSQLADDVTDVVEATGQRVQARPGPAVSRGDSTARTSRSAANVGGLGLGPGGPDDGSSQAGQAAGPPTGSTLDEQVDTFLKDATRLRTRLLGLQSRAVVLKHRVSHTPSVWPSRGRVSSSYGTRRHPLSRRLEFHEGLDIVAKPGSRVCASADGVVSFAGWRGGYGRLVIIAHGYGIETWYGHNSVLKVPLGQKVSKGQVVALSGSTGSSTGPHVHYEVRLNGRPVDPRSYLP